MQDATTAPGGCWERCQVEKQPAQDLRELQLAKPTSESKSQYFSILLGNLYRPSVPTHEEAVSSYWDAGEGFP